jgi:hypothetical protein
MDWGVRRYGILKIAELRKVEESKGIEDGRAAILDPAIFQ